MTNWDKRPTIINEWTEDFDYIMSIDENGTNDLNGMKMLKRNKPLEFMRAVINESLYKHDRWFTISGIVLKKEDFNSFKDSVNTIKFHYWRDGLYNYKNGERRVVFHSREIRRKEGPFNPKLINFNDFLIDLTDMICNANYKIYSSSIDKINHVNQYANPYEVYDLCLNFIIERYCRQLNREGKKGILMLEARGKNEDKAVLTYLVNLLSNGNNYHDSSHFSNIVGVYFNEKWCFSKNKGKASFIQLELTDLVSFPIFKYMKTGEKDRAFEAIESKLDNAPYYMGHGIKRFP
ncbi:DUF3800 domain-containing protein [Alteribacter aurantiacus]|uniref:DUF3800 domain-containing protein n=1 Tax=Alteribacter aurantiacus TaxID=254410 RepID=UPI0003F778D4|nr:DUF3800 domain-containing protein [Alteribacter aurantiacus]